MKEDLILLAILGVALVAVFIRACVGDWDDQAVEDEDRRMLAASATAYFDKMTGGEDEID